MKTYTGERGIRGIQVLIDGETSLPPRYDLKKVSNNGFEWTYEGDEPAQLALALLADHLGDDARALRYYDAFMREVVAYFENDWCITSDEIDHVLAGLDATID